MKILTAFIVLIWTCGGLAVTEKVYKSSAYGHSFHFPADWHPVVEDEPSDNGLAIPVDKASYITFYKNKTKGNDCKDKRDCSLTNISLGHKNVRAYANELKWIDDHIKYEKTSSPPKTRVQKQKFNGYDIDIVLKEVGKEEIQVYTFFYCSSSNLISYFLSKRRQDALLDIKKPVSIEKLYTEEQFSMVNSFRCPKGTGT